MKELFFFYDQLGISDDDDLELSGIVLVVDGTGDIFAPGADSSSYI